MDIKTTKIGLVKAILDSEDEEFIQKIAAFINKEQADFWDELNPAEQQEIKQGIEELNQGKRTSYETVLRKLDQ